MSNAIWGGLFFCTLSIWLLIDVIKNILKYEPSKKWKSTTGEIQDHENIQLHPSKHRDLFVEYKYIVAGKEYSGSKVALYTLIKPEVKELEKQFSNNSNIQVFYNPKQPTESLLKVGGRKEKSSSDLFMALIGLGVGIALVIAGYYGILEDA